MVLLRNSLPALLALFGLISSASASPDFLRTALHRNLDVMQTVNHYKHNVPPVDADVSSEDSSSTRRSVDSESFSDLLLRRGAPPKPKKMKSAISKLTQMPPSISDRNYADCRKQVAYFRKTHQDIDASLMEENCPSKRELMRRSAPPPPRRIKDMKSKLAQMPQSSSDRNYADCRKQVAYFRKTHQDIDASLMEENYPSKRLLEDTELPGPLLARSDDYASPLEYSGMLDRRDPKGGRMKSGPGGLWTTQNQDPQSPQTESKRSLIPEGGLYRRDAMMGGAMGRQPRSRPKPETAARRASDDAARKRQQAVQDQQDTAARGRVDADMQHSQAQVQSSMADAHAKCQKLLAIEDKQEKDDTAGLARLKRDIVKLPDGNKKTAMQSQIKYLTDRAVHKVYQYNRLQDLQEETQADFEAMKTFNQQANDAQHAEFNDNGKSKSEAQKEAERALAGFMKFLHIFGEILSALSNIIPGEGEILGLGIKLAEIGADTAKAAKVGESVAKIAKVINKANSAVKDVNDLQKYLGMTPGKQQIQGMNGEIMQKWQNWMLNQLYTTMSKNLADDSKNIDPSVHIAQPFGNLQYPPHKERLKPNPIGALSGGAGRAMRSAMR